MALLTACGGGGSSDSSYSTTNNSTSTAAINLTAENTRDVTEVALLNSFQNLAAATSDIFTGVIVEPKTANFHFFTIDEIQSFLNKIATAEDSFTGVVNTSSDRCDISGTIETTLNIANTYSISSGDYIILNSKKCIDEVGVEVSGAMKITFNTPMLSLDLAGVYQLNATFEFTNFSTTISNDSFIINGKYTLEIDHDYYGYNSSISAQELTTAIGSLTQIVKNLNTEQVFTNNTNELTVNSSVTVIDSSLGGSFTISTVEDFDFYNSADDAPLDGVMKITGANGSSILISVQPSNLIQIDTDINGDGIIDDTKTASWSSLTN